MVAEEPPEFRFTVFQSDSVPAEVFQQVADVFRENYREANVGYLEKNLGKLRFLSTAYDESGQMAAFAMGESRVMDLPGTPASSVRLAGLCCVSPPFRRPGLFGRMEGLVLGAYELPPTERSLSCGRCAHPASFRGFARNPYAVPKRGLVPSAWHREVGAAIAEAYGSPGFDPDTFVVAGSGVPIGWPIIDIEASPEEWELFAPVDRSRGDSLLGIGWQGSAPDGWVV